MPGDFIIATQFFGRNTLAIFGSRDHVSRSNIKPIIQLPSRYLKLIFVGKIVAAVCTGSVRLVHGIQGAFVER